MTASSAATRFALKIASLPADVPVGEVALAGSFVEVGFDAPAVLVGQLSAQRGDGVFESISVVDGHAQELEAHLARLENSAALCDLPAPNLAQWRAAIALTLANLPSTGDFALRLVLERDGGAGSSVPVAAAVAAVAPGAAVALGAFAPAAGAAVAPGAVPPAPALATAWLVAAPAPDATAVREHGLSAVTLDRGIDSGAAARAPWLLLGAKTLSYAVNMAAIREAKRRGADEAIFVTSDGFVLEAATSSLIVRLRDELVTPAPSGGILQGTTQLSLFEYLERTGRHTATRDIPTSTLQLVDAAWLVSSTRLAVPITAIDERAIGVDAALTREFNAYLRSPRD